MKVLNQTNASAYLVQSRFKICEGSQEGTRKTTEERICEIDDVRHELCLCWNGHTLLILDEMWCFTSCVLFCCSGLSSG